MSFFDFIWQLFRMELWLFNRMIFRVAFNCAELLRRLPLKYLRLATCIMYLRSVLR